ncbi:MAG: helix-turn-helix domain-containing protein [Nitrososphaera sp.]|nr:helix-turn-helix domain-containing protein [Nitrososphaera sp.]
MPVPIPVPIRQSIVQRHEQGESLWAIAKELDISLWTVRQIWRRYRKQAEAGLLPKYESGGKSRRKKLIYRAGIWLKRLHGNWGGGLIRLLLKQRWSDKKIPHERTLQRWFREAGVNIAKRRLPAQNSSRAKRVHEVWQMDATSHVALADGSEVSWLTISDEMSGAILAAEVFPPKSLGTSGVAAGSGRFTRYFPALGNAGKVSG